MGNTVKAGGGFSKVLCIMYVFEQINFHNCNYISLIGLPCDDIKPKYLKICCWFD